LDYHLQDHNFKFEEILIFHVSKGYNNVLGAKNPYFRIDMNWETFYFVLNWIRYMSTKSHTHKTYGTLRKLSFSKKGTCSNSHIKVVLDHKKGLFLHWKFEWGACALVLPLHIKLIFKKKPQNLTFWWYFKVPWANYL
jgi:hypothetical protein